LFIQKDLTRANENVISNNDCFDEIFKQQE